MPPHTLASKARQQGGVYVHHAVFVSSRYLPEAQPTTLNDEADVCSDKLFFDALAEPVNVGVVLLAYGFYFQSGVFCLFDAGYG